MSRRAAAWNSGGKSSIISGGGADRELVRGDGLVDSDVVAVVDDDVFGFFIDRSITSSCGQKVSPLTVDLVHKSSAWWVPSGDPAFAMSLVCDKGGHLVS